MTPMRMPGSTVEFYAKVTDVAEFHRRELQLGLIWLIPCVASGGQAPLLRNHRVVVALLFSPRGGALLALERSALTAVFGPLAPD